MIPMKTIVISTGIIAVALFLNAYLPMAVSRFPMLWSSFNSWLKPPYLLVVIHVIITIIVASSKYFQSEENEIQTVHRARPLQMEVKEADFVVTFPPPITVLEVERSEVVYEEEKEEKEISGMINGGDHQVSSKIDESENLPPVEKKPLVSARSGYLKPVKSTAKGGGGKRKKALRVVKPKPTFENTWKSVMEELKSTAPLTSRYRKPDTFGLDAGDVKVKPALRKSVTFRDITNHPKSPPMVKVKEEMLPSDEELNRRVEAFIKKTKLERLQSMRLDKRSIVA